MAGTGDRALAVITPRSVQGMPAMEARAADAAAMLDDARFIAKILLTEGFELLNFHPVAISFAGSPAMFARVFGLRLLRRTFTCGRDREVDGFDVESEDTDKLSSLPVTFEGRAGRMAIARPPRLIDDVSTPMPDFSTADLPIWSLSDELAISTWADGTRASGTTGHGVVAAQIGTGHYRHRFFSDRGYRVLPTLLGPGQVHPQRDEHGHGTGEAACLFGAAPDVRLRPIKGLLDPVGDLLMAVDSTPTPDLIMNSWGYDVDHAGWTDLAQSDPNLHNYLKIMAAAIAFATAKGIVVCAAAPSTWQSFPACHPSVIAITAVTKGAVMPRPKRYLGASNLYPGRMLPDIWSDATKSVRAGLDLIGCTYPVQPGAALADPYVDETGSDEAFALCDIEQAASPLAAGRLALLLEQNRGLSPAAFKEMVTEGIIPPGDDLLETGTSEQRRVGAPALAANDLPRIPRNSPVSAAVADSGVDSLAS